MIETPRRAQYLQRLGIDEWVLRSAPPPSSAASLASSPWQQLQAEVRSCSRCALHQGRQQAVFGSGDAQAEWMVIGEAPGAEEDEQGEPFVGAAGQLLTAMLGAIDLPRERVFITNVLKCRPPDDRDPQVGEVRECLRHLYRQIESIRPQLVLAVGRIAAQALLGCTTPLAELRGQVHHFGPLNTPLIVTYHPAYLLRSPAEKRKAWEDLKFARQMFAASKANRES